MNIIVCVKQVLDPEIPPAKFKIDPAAKQIVPTAGVPPVISVYDERALEAACRLKDKHKGKITAISMGTEKAADVIKPAMAMGADDGFVLQDAAFENLDSAGRFPGVQFRLAEHLGCHQALIELSAQRYATARLLGRGQSDWPATESPPQDGLLLVVGRGSADPQTQAELAQFVEYRRVRTAVAAVQIGYLALARPSLDDVLVEVAKSAWRDVVVQPHLLFAGELLTRLRERVERAATEDPNRRWWLADHLGPDAAIVAALAARCTDTT